MFGLVVIEVMTPSGHLSNIDNILCPFQNSLYYELGIYNFDCGMRKESYQSCHDDIAIHYFAFSAAFLKVTKTSVLLIATQLSSCHKHNSTKT